MSQSTAKPPSSYARLATLTTPDQSTSKTESGKPKKDQKLSKSTESQRSTEKTEKDPDEIVASYTVNFHRGRYVTVDPVVHGEIFPERYVEESLAQTYIKLGEAKAAAIRERRERDGGSGRRARIPTQ